MKKERYLCPIGTNKENDEPTNNPMKRIWTAWLMGWVGLCAMAQTDTARYASPLDIPLLLSANFGELRTNHFHGGIDLKTQGVTDKPVHSVADGYVARVKVSAGGYGKALYVNHPDGTTAVYGHLNAFSSAVDAYVEAYQYAHETFAADLEPDSTLFPVRRGEVIGRSGNTGYSMGPHLHMEFRQTDTEELFDPLPYYIKRVKDTTPPRASALAVYPHRGEGCVNGGGETLIRPVREEGRRVRLGMLAKAWGKVSLGIAAEDRMDRTTNRYGVRSVTLWVDSTELFAYTMDRVAFAENRTVNSLADYALREQRGIWMMRSYVAPGNKLRAVRTDVRRGTVCIDEERDYHFVYRLEDLAGNRTEYSFTLRGERTALPDSPAAGPHRLRFDRANVVQEAGMQLTIPRGMLYDDVDLKVGVRTDPDAASWEYTLHDSPLPFDGDCELRIGVRRPQPDADSARYYIQRIGKGRPVSMGGTYADGWVRTTIREGGTYRVAVDSVAPVLTPLTGGETARTLRYKATDVGTGVKAWRGTVDGQFVLVAYSAMRGVLECRLPTDRLPRGRHLFRLWVTDGAGNIATVERYVQL